MDPPGGVKGLGREEAAREGEGKLGALRFEGRRAGEGGTS